MSVVPRLTLRSDISGFLPLLRNDVGWSGHYFEVKSMSPRNWHWWPRPYTRKWRMRRIPAVTRKRCLSVRPFLGSDVGRFQSLLGIDFAGSIPYTRKWRLWVPAITKKWCWWVSAISRKWCRWVSAIYSEVTPVGSSHYKEVSRPLLRIDTGESWPYATKWRLWFPAISSKWFRWFLVITRKWCRWVQPLLGWYVDVSRPLLSIDIGGSRPYTWKCTSLRPGHFLYVMSLCSGYYSGMISVGPCHYSDVMSMGLRHYYELPLLGPDSEDLQTNQ